MVTAIRLTLTVFVLVIVWFNVHWSVSLALTLISIRNELADHIIKQIIQIDETEE